ncbi:hypothetical protein BU15DRAFT_81308 [Melanogaster broomeanus]|nr:hypothetical protein BU15DRAFT_81308 [Melanogaster broomeanus]
MNILSAVRRNSSRSSTRSSKDARRLSSIHEDEVETSESDQPKHDRIPTGRKKMRASTSSIQKQLARKTHPNHGLCLLTRRGEPVVETCHLVAGSTKRHTITQLEYAWGLRYNSLNLDSRFNMFFLRSDWHTLFEPRAVAAIRSRRIWKPFAFVPLPNKNAKGRRNVNLDGGWGESTTFQYHVLCTPDLKEPIHRFDGPEKDAGYTVHSLSFPNLGPLTSHVRPHFVVANSALKLTRLALAQLLGQLAETLAQISHETPQSARNRLDMIIVFTMPADLPRSVRPVQMVKETSLTTAATAQDAESENGDSAEVSTLSKKPNHGRRNTMDSQSQSSDTEESVMHDDEWSSAEETAWIEEICDWTEKCREATSSEGGWAPDAVNDEQMAAYAKEPSRPALPLKVGTSGAHAGASYREPTPVFQHGEVLKQRLGYLNSLSCRFLDVPK